MTLNPLALPHPLIRLPAMLMASIGLWLVASPWFLPGPYPPGAIWSDFTAGLVLMGLGTMKFARPLDNRPAWIAIGFGLWFLFSPWIVGFAWWAPLALRNTVITASLVMLVASWGIVGAEVA